MSQGNDKRTGEFGEGNLLLRPEDGAGYVADPLLGRNFTPYTIVRNSAGLGNQLQCVAVHGHVLQRESFFAIKILTVSATDDHFDGLSPELSIIAQAQRAQGAHPDAHHLLGTHDYFLHHGCAGHHMCIVTDVLGPSLETLQFNRGSALPFHAARRATKQLLQALDYLHGTCGWIHTDIKPDNVLVFLSTPHAPHISAYLQANASTYFSPPLQHPASPDPVYVAKSQPLPAFGLTPSLDNIEVCLVDYGEAFPAKMHTLDAIIQADAYRAPETFLDHPWSTPIDIWSLGCLVFFLVANQGLFKELTVLGEWSPDIHLWGMVLCLGPFPKSFLDRCGRGMQYFQDDNAATRRP